MRTRTLTMVFMPGLKSVVVLACALGLLLAPRPPVCAQNMTLLGQLAPYGPGNDLYADVWAEGSYAYACWEAEYSTPIKNEPGLFKAKSD